MPALAAAIAELVTELDEHRAINWVVGIRPDLARELGMQNPASDYGSPGLNAIQTFGDTSAAPEPLQSDIWLFLHSSSSSEMFDCSRASVKALTGVASVAREQAGFAYKDSRDITGFIDGTENPSLVEASSVAIIHGGTAGAGGSVALLMRFVHDIDAFGTMPESEQEKVIGRTKADSVELGEEVMPEDSHVSKVVIEEGGEELEIYRRSYPFGGACEAGLMFLAFTNNPTTTNKMLASMYGLDGSGSSDRLLAFTKADGAAYYFVPSMEALAGLGS